MTVPFLIRKVTVYFSPTESMITMMIRKNMKMNNNNSYNNSNSNNTNNNENDTIDICAMLCSQALNDKTLHLMYTYDISVLCIHIIFFSSIIYIKLRLNI